MKTAKELHEIAAGMRGESSVYDRILLAAHSGERQTTWKGVLGSGIIDDLVSNGCTVLDFSTMSESHYVIIWG